MVENDLEFLRFLYRTIRADIAQLPLSDEEKSRFFEQQFQAQHLHYQGLFPAANFDIVLAGENAIGRIYVQYGSSEFHIIDISILPEYRGLGIGTNLLREVLARAKQEKIPVRLRVVPANPAVNLYMRLGFRIFADEQTHWYLEWNPSQDRKN